MTKGESIMEVDKMLNIPIMDIQIVRNEDLTPVSKEVFKSVLKEASNGVSKPVSKEQWDNIRLLQLKEYIMECLDKSVKIDQCFIDEYNSLNK